MIRINKNFKDQKEYPQDLFDDTRKESLMTILEDENVPEKNDLYKTEEVTEKLHLLYKSKCAYCESKEGNPRVGTLHIEHYRPKKWQKKNTENFNGYYWLVYEWTNLLLACRDCNSKKGTKFPLQNDNRIKKHSEFLNQRGELNWQKTRIDSDLLESEEALFLNPEVDNPDQYLKFCNDGQLIGIGIKGVTTVHPKLGLDLNDADLIKERFSIIKTYIAKINDLIEYIQQRIKSGKVNKMSEQELSRSFFDVFFRQLEISCNPEFEFSRFRKCIYEDFENFIISYLPDNIKNEIRNYYLEYQAGTL